MPIKNPHVYASRTSADIQQANPSNPNFKAKSMNKKPQMTHASNIGGTENDAGPDSTSAGQVNKLTKKGLDVAQGPKGLGDKFGRLAKVRHTKTSY